MKLSIPFGLTIAFLLSACSNGGHEDLTQYVDPFIGTAEHGHTFPGAATPFGMVQLSPDNGRGGWDWCSGYNWIDSTIVGFSHKHLSGTGIGDLADILFQPTSKTPHPGEFIKKTDFIRRYQSYFSHDEEEASPGYYSVLLRDWDNRSEQVAVELTATPRVGIHHYQFKKNEQVNLMIDLGFAINWDKPEDTFIRIVNDTLITGYRKSVGWANKQEVYFAASSSEPIKEFVLYKAGLEIPGNTIVSGVSTEAFLKFGINTRELMLKVALSPVSCEGAVKNLLAEATHWRFEDYRRAAQESWNNELQKIRVESRDLSLKTTFYTALYHSFLAPSLFSDVDGKYRGLDREVHHADGWKNYTVFSLWDTFRAAHPLYTITQTARVPDMIQAMLVHYKESGLLPVWTLEGCETNCMVGYHAIPVLVDAAFKGFDFDYELAFEAMKASAMQNIRGSEEYRKYGFIPADLVNESVSKTLEYAYDDWCIAQMARLLNIEEDYKYYTERSKAFEKVFDPVSGFMRGKTSEGKWQDDFNPLFSKHGDDEYTEGNAWQHTWFVPHNPERLIELMGGPEQFSIKLDSLFSHKGIVEGEFASPDISGMIGQYAHGNEPSHHVVYLYNFVNQGRKTQKIVHQIRTELYSDQPNGICGNEDCGQMSAWYVFNAMGFYPFNPADGKYQLGTPAFDKLVINLENGKTFTVKAQNLSKDQFYVKSVSLNGQELNRTYITHQEILAGGELVFDMEK